MHDWLTVTCEVARFVNPPPGWIAAPVWAPQSPPLRPLLSRSLFHSLVSPHYCVVPRVWTKWHLQQTRPGPITPYQRHIVLYTGVLVAPSWLPQTRFSHSIASSRATLKKLCLMILELKFCNFWPLLAPVAVIYASHLSSSPLTVPFFWGSVVYITFHLTLLLKRLWLLLCED